MQDVIGLRGFAAFTKCRREPQKPGQATAVSRVEQGIRFHGAIAPAGSGEAATDVAEVARILSWGQDEAEFLTELQSGSEIAFDCFVQDFHASVYNLVFGMLNSPADAADVTQEVFLKAFRGIRGFRQNSSLKTWLYRIAVRQALNQRRWWWRHLRRQISLDAEKADGAPVLQLQTAEPSPYESYASQEARRVVRQALGKVPEPFRTAVILRDLEGLAYEEIAEVLDVSAGTVKSRILRGRRALRELLEPLVIPHRLASNDARIEEGGSLGESVAAAAMQENFRISPARGGGR